jgi:hypothetical protein
VNQRDEAGTPQLSYRWFGAWALVSAGLITGLLGALTIGIVVLPVSLAAAVLLALAQRPAGHLTGLITGLGLPLLYVAYLNRQGPGMVCTSTATGGSCVQEYSPWAWAVPGMLLLATGVIIFLRLRRQSRCECPSVPERRAA